MSVTSALPLPIQDSEYRQRAAGVDYRGCSASSPVSASVIVSAYVTTHPDQLSIAIRSWVGAKMSTSGSWRRSGAALTTSCVDPGEWLGSLHPLKICKRGQSICLTPLKRHTLSFKTVVVSDNSASFTSSRMKDLCQNWKVN